MKLFRILPLAVIALTLFASCDETIDNDLEVEKSVRLSVSFKNPDLDLLWGEGWKTEWQYDWDSSDTTYGLIGYSTPEIFKGTIYNLDANTGKRYSNFFKLFGLNENPATLPIGGKYDMLLYNADTENIIFQASDDFENYTASIDTSHSSFSYMNVPDELLGAMVTGVDLSKPSSDSMVIDVELKPYSIIYLFQIVIQDNIDSIENRITEVNELFIQGLARSVNLFTGQTSSNTVSILTHDIKPLQNHSNVRKSDGTILQNADIAAARIMTWGLPGIVPTETARVDGRNSLYYLGMRLTRSDGSLFNTAVDVTEQILNKPAGGVITVFIDAQESPVYVF